MVLLAYSGSNEGFSVTSQTDSLRGELRVIDTLRASLNQQTLER